MDNKTNNTFTARGLYKAGAYHFNTTPYLFKKMLVEDNKNAIEFYKKFAKKKLQFNNNIPISTQVQNKLKQINETLEIN